MISLTVCVFHCTAPTAPHPTDPQIEQIEPPILKDIPQWRIPLIVVIFMTRCVKQSACANTCPAVATLEDYINGRFNNVWSLTFVSPTNTMISEKLILSSPSQLLPWFKKNYCSADFYSGFTHFALSIYVWVWACTGRDMRLVHMWTLPGELWFIKGTLPAGRHAYTFSVL